MTNALPNTNALHAYGLGSVSPPPPPDYWHAIAVWGMLGLVAVFVLMVLWLWFQK